MWGCSSWEQSRISRRNRSAATLTSSSGCRTLRATWRPSGVAREIDPGVAALADLALDLVLALEGALHQRQHVPRNGSDPRGGSSNGRAGAPGAQGVTPRRVQSSTSVRIRLRIAHQSAPQMLLCRSVMRASPVMPGRRVSAPGSRTRDSTTPPARGRCGRRSPTGGLDPDPGSAWAISRAGWPSRDQGGAGPVRAMRASTPVPPRSGAACPRSRPSGRPGCRGGATPPSPIPAARITSDRIRFCIPASRAASARA